MAVHEALKELTTRLSLAATGENIGRALLHVAKTKLGVATRIQAVTKRIGAA